MHGKRDVEDAVPGRDSDRRAAVGPYAAGQCDGRRFGPQAYFDAPADPPGFFSPGIWSATGRAGSGSQDPCATLYYPAGDSQVARAARCAQAGPGLWMLTTSDGFQAGFARQADGVTITLTGYAADKAALRHAIMAAHRAGDAELRPRTGKIGTAPVNLLFL